MEENIQIEIQEQQNINWRQIVDSRFFLEEILAMGYEHHQEEEWRIAVQRHLKKEKIRRKILKLHF